jgi:hypothetical protein
MTMTGKIYTYLYILHALTCTYYILLNLLGYLHSTFYAPLPLPLLQVYYYLLLFYALISVLSRKNNNKGLTWTWTGLDDWWLPKSRVTCHFSCHWKHEAIFNTYDTSLTLLILYYLLVFMPLIFQSLVLVVCDLQVFNLFQTILILT